MFFNTKTLVSFVVLSLSVSSVSAAPQPRALASVVTKCTKDKTVALTFDDGPWVYAYDVSKALVAAGAKGTFFLNGNNYECIYSDDNAKRVKYLHDKGHQLASHTWSHPHLNSLSQSQMKTEMTKVNDALKKIAGVTPAFMRPPYGEYNDDVREVASSLGLTVVTWDFDSQDSVGASASESKKLYDQAIAKKPKTMLPLNHEVYSTTAHDVLPYAISKLQAAGYKLVTLAECLGQEPYTATTSPGTKDGSWKC